jgi:hypothetical protein
MPLKKISLLDKAEEVAGKISEKLERFGTKGNTNLKKPGIKQKTVSLQARLK